MKHTSILTPDMQARLAIMNNAYRALRAAGLRLVRQTTTPADGGMPIIDLGPIDQPQIDQLLNVADSSTRNLLSQHHSASAYGVRVTWTTKQ